MITVAIALAQSIASESVKAYLSHRRLSETDLDDVSATVASAVAGSLLRASVSPSGALGRIESKIDDLTAQPAHIAMDRGRRLLGEATAPHRDAIARRQLLEQARLAFLDAASAAAPGQATVNAELLVAGCWLALGSSEDVESAMLDALGSCLVALLDSCHEYRTVPGLGEEYRLQPVLAKAFYGEAQRAQARARLRRAPAQRLQTLGALFNEIQNLRRSLGQHGLQTLLGYILDERRLMPLSQMAMTVTGNPVTQCEPSFILEHDNGFLLPHMGLGGGVWCRAIALTDPNEPRRDLFALEAVMGLVGVRSDPPILIGFGVDRGTHHPTEREESAILTFLDSQPALIAGEVTHVDWNAQDTPISGRTYVRYRAGSYIRPTLVLMRFRIRHTTSSGNKTHHVVRIHMPFT